MPRGVYDRRQTAARAMPMLTDIQHVWQDKESVSTYLLEKGVIEMPPICPACGGDNSFSWKNMNMKTIRCKRRECRHQFSIYKGEKKTYIHIHIKQF